MNIEIIVGENLRAIRVERKLNQTQVGEIIGHTQTFISKCENASIKIPLDVLLGYANHFNVSLDYIFGRTNNPQGEVGIRIEDLTKEARQAKTIIQKCLDPKNELHYQFKKMLIDIIKEADK